jgi:phosphotransacetylase
VKCSSVHNRITQSHLEHVFLAPDLETGNILAKQLIFLAQADAAGLVLGAAFPSS